MKFFKLQTIWAALVLILVAALFYLYAPPSGDAQRYADLHRAGASYQRAWSGQPSFSDCIAALAHLSSPSNYYRGRLEANEQALVASGYLVKLTVPVPDLRAKTLQVRVTLSNTLQQTGAYYQAKLDHSIDEVRLLCRKEDIALWQRVLKEYQ